MNVLKLAVGTRECEDCMEIFDIRQENLSSQICAECLQGAIDIVRTELTQRGMTVPSCLEPPSQYEDQ